MKVKNWRLIRDKSLYIIKGFYAKRCQTTTIIDKLNRGRQRILVFQVVQINMPNCHKNRIRVFISFFLFVMVLNACKSPKAMINDEPLADECPIAAGFRNITILPNDQFLSDTLLTSTYSIQTLYLANAIGSIPTLKEFTRIKKLEAQQPNDISLKVTRLDLENELDKRLDMIALNLENVENIFECRMLNILRIDTELNSLNNNIQNKYTTAAIVVGGLTTIIVGGLLLAGSTGDGKDWAGVVGGVTATVLAIRSAKIDRTAQLEHKDNPIRVIWEGNNNTNIFPPSIWYLMNQENVLPDSDLSPRQAILKKWRESNLMLGNKDNKEHLDLLMSDAGIYTSDLLRLRILFLEEIETSIEDLSRALFLTNSEFE